MVDKMTGLKPKKAVTSKQKIAIEKSKTETPKAQKLETGKKELAKDKINRKSQTTAQSEVESPAAQLAKSGKRSAKALKEANEQQAKEARKATKTEQESTPKKSAPMPRTRVQRAGKKYREVAKLIDKDKIYSLVDALNLAVQTSTVKFDSTVELHVNLGVDPKMADQNVRDSVILPAGTGKTLRIAVFAEGDGIAEAKSAGADIAGDTELLGLLDKEETNFDVLITSPQLMARLGKYAKLLGPKGLMPNPKSGTITTDITKAIKEAKAGRVEYRVDQAGIIHLGIGKVSFGTNKLQQNADTVLTSIRSAKPSNLKGIYVNSVYVTTTMGPSIKVSL